MPCNCRAKLQTGIEVLWEQAQNLNCTRRSQYPPFAESQGGSEETRLFFSTLLTHRHANTPFPPQPAAVAVREENKEFFFPPRSPAWNWEAHRASSASDRRPKRALANKVHKAQHWDSPGTDFPLLLTPGGTQDTDTPRGYAAGQQHGLKVGSPPTLGLEGAGSGGANTNGKKTP